MPERPRVLDLYCCAGGMSMGLHRAGFEVVGVDLEPQPNYPFRFLRDDALEVLGALLGGEAIKPDNGRVPGNDRPLRLADFDGFHGSPPCQRWAGSSHWHDIDHPDLIAPTRDLFRASGLPYSIENVPRAPLIDPVMLCGTMFGLGADGFEIRRHRLFECSFPVMVPGCSHSLPSLPIFGHGVNSDFKRRHGRSVDVAIRREAMGIDWTTRDELAEAIPPAFGEHIGHYLMAEIRARAAA